MVTPFQRFPAERPCKLAISFAPDVNGFHYVQRLRRDGALIPCGNGLAGEPFPPETPVATVVARALALARQHTIGQIEISDPCRKLLKTSDRASLSVKQLRMMTAGSPAG